ncbi:putative inorganic phosphate cotransporter [Parasteatoda tepidariorum]|uniref:putative inorganic phosphate cotransporter n=1 Tax=Parasteatoda tepidariorum TaxID=114398 RepID=UPI00077FB0DB|nr:putative inorganic phosphate cotransporter [Parasteatoda tepidariorum]
MRKWLSSYSVHGLLQRRYVVTLLGFLCSIVTQSQRLNIALAMVVMANSTNVEPKVFRRNYTECPITTEEKEYTKLHQSEFSWDPELQGYILSAGYLGYILTQIPGGILAGKYGSKILIVGSVLFSSICNLLSPIAARQHPYVFLAVQVIRGMSQGPIMPAMSLLMARWFPKCERGFLSAFIYCGFPIGAFICSILSGPICEIEFDNGWPFIFYIFGLLGVLVSLLVAIYYVETPSQDTKISEKELQYITESCTNSSETPPPTPWCAIISSIPTYSLIIALFGQYWMAFYFLADHPTYMGTILHIPIKQNGILSSFPHLAQSLAGFLACCMSFWLIQNDTSKVNLVRKGCNSISCFGFALGMMGIYFSGCDNTWNEICLFIATAAVGFGFPGSLIVSVDMSPTFCGVVMGITSTLGSSAGIVVPVLVGELTKEKQILAQWDKMFIITAAIAAVSGIVFHVFGSTDTQPYDPSFSKDVNSEKVSKQDDCNKNQNSTKL